MNQAFVKVGTRRAVLAVVGEKALSPAKITRTLRRIEKVMDAQEGPASFVDTLPFVGPAGAKRRKDQSPRDFWHNVKSTGDYDKDGTLGSRYAYLTMQAIKAEKFQPLLGWIVLDMIENKCPADIVVGYFQTIADIALGIYPIPAPHVRLARGL